VPGPVTGQAEPEDWTREASKESKADSSKDNEEDETDDELVIEEPDPSASKEEGAEKLSAVSPPQLTGPASFETNNSSTVRESGATHPRQRWRCMQPRLCNYCWKTFSNSFNLKQHIVNVHIQSQGVNCTICDKVVKNKWYLRKHLVTAHGAPLKRSKNTENNNVASND